jgi:aminoglycoside phosphotransferase (APT) family kinase protein
MIGPALIRDCINTAFPDSRIVATEILTGGLINTNIKIEFSSRQPPVVLRLYRGDAELCLKETAVLELVHATVPVPRVIHVEPNGINDSGPFSILEFVNGVTFQQLKRKNDLEAIHQAAASVGETLARIGSFQFAKPGRFEVDNGLSVGARYMEGPDPIPRLLDSFLESEHLHQRIDAALQQQLHNLTWSWADRLRAFDNDSHLVHCDFGNRNMLVDCVEGSWQVAAVLDWEFALSGSPLLDVGHFLRHETEDKPLREPYFSRAFVEAGGFLPDDWRRISLVLDLTALVECLTHDNLPDDVVEEILQLIKSTLRRLKAV